jgi:hypothetical protein
MASTACSFHENVLNRTTPDIFLYKIVRTMKKNETYRTITSIFESEDTKKKFKRPDGHWAANAIPGSTHAY